MIKKSDLKLVKADSKELNTPPDVFEFGGDVDAIMLSNILVEKMKDLGGVGLSANQVGVNLKVFVMGTGEITYTIFNPKIISTSHEAISEDEGCLSFPGIYLKVLRPKTVLARYQNVKGQTVEEEFHGLTARIFLHEYDHMLGLTFKQKVSKMKWDLAYNRMVKRTKRIIKRGVQNQLKNIAEQVKEKNVDNSTRVS